MSRIGKGLLAGLAATIVLSVLMVIKAAMGVMPELDLPTMIAGMMGSPDSPMIGWVVHFMIGVIGYGLAVAFLNELLPGNNPTVHGVILGFIGWLLMMVMVMPMAGVGMFGMNMGLMAPVTTLALHLIFGAVLGGTYGKLYSGASGATLERA